MKFGDDWTGVFVRGDNALMGYAMPVRLWLEALDRGEQDVMGRVALESLLELLGSAYEVRDPGEVQRLREFDECVAPEPDEET
jgi:hypothetical protein